MHPALIRRRVAFDLRSTARRAPGRAASAETRRAEVLTVAVEEFSRRGFEVTSTLAIARAAGISHAYLFRLFPTKQALSLATMQECIDRMHDAMVAAAARAPVGRELEAMGHAYADRRLLRLQQHAHAAGCSDPEMRDLMHAGWSRLIHLVCRASGAPASDVQQLFASAVLELNLDVLFGASRLMPDAAHHDE